MVVGDSATHKEQVHEYGGTDHYGRKGPSVKKKTKFLKIAAIALVATALPLARSGIASADYAASPYDFVGVGGDTPQFSADFLANGDADGDPVGECAGLQATGAGVGAGGVREFRKRRKKNRG